MKPGQEVLINGASGGVGTVAVQIAKALGAEVTGVCSTRSVDMVRSIGSDHVIDYTKEGFTQGAERYDLILDNVANHRLSGCWRVLAPGGKHLPNSGRGGMGYIVKALVVSMFVRQQGSTFVATPKRGALLELGELIEAEKVAPVIEHVHPLAAFSEAMHHLDEGHARGKVVISLGD